MKTNQTNYISVTEAARRLDLTPGGVRKACRAGTIPGATRAGRDWWVPLTGNGRIKREPRQRGRRPQNAAA